MSTHNIGFYEDLTKIIFELSSNIIKYAPYFFFWMTTYFSIKTNVVGTCLNHLDMAILMSTHNMDYIENWKKHSSTSIK